MRCVRENRFLTLLKSSASLVVQSKNPSAMQETWVQFLGQEDPLEKEMATHSSILAWEIPWTEEPGGYSPWGPKSRTGLATKPPLTSISYDGRKDLQTLPALSHGWGWDPAKLPPTPPPPPAETQRVKA